MGQEPGARRKMDLTVEGVLAQPRVKRLQSTEDFPIRGTLLEARA